jgi:hypothetical protein
MGVYDQRIDVRVDKEMRRYLLDLDQDASKYIRDLIDQDRLSKADPEYIKLKRQELRDQIKALDELEETSKEDPEKVKEILNIAYEHYQTAINDPLIRGTDFKLYLRSNILPKLKAANCNRFDVDTLLKMLEEGKSDA